MAAASSPEVKGEPVTGSPTAHSVQSENQVTCIICYGAIEQSPATFKCPGGPHVYHVACLDNWLTTAASEQTRTNRNCMVCFNRIPLLYGGIVTEPGAVNVGAALNSGGALITENSRSLIRYHGPQFEEILDLPLDQKLSRLLDTLYPGWPIQRLTSPQKLELTEFFYGRSLVEGPNSTTQGQRYDLRRLPGVPRKSLFADCLARPNVQYRVADAETGPMMLFELITPELREELLASGVMIPWMDFQAQTAMAVPCLAAWLVVTSTHPNQGDIKVVPATFYPHRPTLARYPQEAVELQELLQKVLKDLGITPRPAGLFE